MLNQFRISYFVTIFCTLQIVLNFYATANMTHLKEGNKAPVFSGTGQDGRLVSMDDLLGKGIILYFYPKDMTPGCTAESCNLRENYAALRKMGFEVIGVSADSVKRHRKFADKYELPFTLIADTEREIVRAYGVWGPKKFMGREYEGIYRTTFVIDEEGVIINIFDKVDTKNHSQQIIDALNKAD